MLRSRPKASGSTLASRYTLGEEIGHGASGVVFKALDFVTGGMVAIKQVTLRGVAKDQLQLLQREIDLLKLLKNPYIVEYIESFHTRETLYIVMEFVENGSLSQILKKFGRLKESLVALYMVQVLEGLDFLHAQGVIHRDVKGANILISTGGQVKLADFGVATKLESDWVDREPSTVVGTPYWMAPEIIQMSGFTTASDIWSVACTVIELTSGAPPYFELQHMSALFRVVHDAHPPLPAAASDALQDFLLECFRKDTALRPSAEKLKRHRWLRAAHKEAAQPAQPVVVQGRPVQPVAAQPADGDFFKAPNVQEGSNGGADRRDAHLGGAISHLRGLPVNDGAAYEYGGAAEAWAEAYPPRAASAQMIGSPKRLAGGLPHAGGLPGRPAIPGSALSERRAPKKGHANSGPANSAPHVRLSAGCAPPSAAVSQPTSRQNSQPASQCTSNCASRCESQCASTSASKCASTSASQCATPERRVSSARASPRHAARAPFIGVPMVHRSAWGSPVRLGQGAACGTPPHGLCGTPSISSIASHLLTAGDNGCELPLPPARDFVVAAAEGAAATGRPAAAAAMPERSGVVALGAEGSPEEAAGESAAPGEVAAGRERPSKESVAHCIARFRETNADADGYDCLLPVPRAGGSPREQRRLTEAAWKQTLERRLRTPWLPQPQTRPQSPERGVRPACADSAHAGGGGARGVSGFYLVSQEDADPFEHIARVQLQPTAGSEGEAQRERRDRLRTLIDRLESACEQAHEHAPIQACVEKLLALFEEGGSEGGGCGGCGASTEQRGASQRSDSGAAQGAASEARGGARGVAEEAVDLAELFVSEHGMLPLLRLLKQSSSTKVLSSLLELLNAVLQRSGAAVCESACLLGVVPTSLRFAEPSQPPPTKLAAARFVHTLCTRSPLTLQIFVACDGLPALVRLLLSPADSHARVLHAIDALKAVLELKGPVAARNGLCRSLAALGLLELLVQAMREICREQPLHTERAAEICVGFSCADKTVKQRMATREVLPGLIEVIAHPELFGPGPIIKVLRCIKHLCMGEARFMDELQRANAIPPMVALLRGGAAGGRALPAEIHNQCVNALYLLCKISRSRQEEAAVSGVLPPLQALIEQGSPLKQFALPILCDIAKASRRARAELKQHRGVQFYLGLLSTEYWQEAALDALLVWLLDEISFVSKAMETAQGTAALVVVMEAQTSNFVNMLEPLYKIVHNSRLVNRALGRLDGASGVSPFVRALVGRLPHPDVLARRLLLLILSSIYEQHAMPRQLIERHQLTPVVRNIKDSDPGVLVQQIASELSRSFEAHEMR